MLWEQLASSRRRLTLLAAGDQATGRESLSFPIDVLPGCLAPTPRLSRFAALPRYFAKVHWAWAGVVEWIVRRLRASWSAALAPGVVAGRARPGLKPRG